MLVSVVIPTRNRSDFVLRSARSALAQTFKALEVIVVIDGPDLNTIQCLGQINDKRLRVIPLSTNVGGAEARNIGIKAANGQWVAFLDDDDEWLTEKIQKQLSLARSATEPYPVVACRLRAHTKNEQYVWPKRLPEHHETIADYLFFRGSFFQGETLVQTSMLLAPKELLLRVPFRKLPRHQEWDWLLRASEVPGFKLYFEPEPQVIWHIDENRGRISTNAHVNEWEFSLRWIKEYQDRMSKRSYSNFLLTVAASVARKSRSLTAFKFILKEALKSGSPNVWSLATFCAIFLFPPQIRHALRKLKNMSW
jgi:glycosyltransferase involved in cell wall biosynthesis